MIDKLTNKFEAMSPEAFLVAGLAGLILFILLIVVTLKFARRLRGDHFTRKWKSLQKKLPNRQGWRQAVVEADDLLDDALRKNKIKGKTTGERMVNAQKMFSDNDGVWYGHKLRRKIDKNPGYVPKKHEMKKALLGLRIGLKDIGAM